MSRRTTAFVALLGGAAAALGCASPPRPSAELAQAQQAVARAEQEGAGEYAPLPLRLARERLESAERAARAERYRTARREAEVAQVEAELAAATARRARAEEVVDELSRTVQALEMEVVR